eukprot:1765127-Prymnesium_polylepis.1
MEDEQVNAQPDKSPAAASSTATGSTHVATSSTHTATGSTRRNRPTCSGQDAQAKKMHKVWRRLKPIVSHVSTALSTSRFCGDVGDFQ